MKATKVDGIYSADRKQDKDAQRLERMTYIEVLNRGLQVMDATAISLCMDNKLPIIVFDLTRSGNIKRIVLGEAVGSIVSSGGWTHGGYPERSQHNQRSRDEDAGSPGRARAGVRGGAHRTRVRRAARWNPRRLLRDADAGQSDGVHLGPGRSDHRDPTLRG